MRQLIPMNITATATCQRYASVREAKAYLPILLLVMIGNVKTPKVFCLFNCANLAGYQITIK